MLEGFSEVVAQEGVDQQVDGGVGVRHAMTPNPQLQGSRRETVYGTVFEAKATSTCVTAVLLFTAVALEELNFDCRSTPHHSILYKLFQFPELSRLFPVWSFQRSWERSQHYCLIFYDK